MKTLAEVKYAIEPTMGYFKVYDYSGEHSTLVQAYLCSDGKWHLDNDSLKMAEEVLQTYAEDMTV